MHNNVNELINFYNRYCYIKKLNKKSIVSAYNVVKNSTKFSTKDILKQNPPLKEFIEMFYSKKIDSEKLSKFKLLFENI